MRTMPYNSRDVFYKSIFGSVEAHRVFKLRVLLPRDGYVKGVVAVFSKDGGVQSRFELLDDLNELEGKFYTRSCDISLEEGLYFYYFIMYTVNGERQLLDMGHGVGEFDPAGGKNWQLTVYEENFRTPSETGGGIIYQIFPDRFYKGENNLEYPSDRFVRNDWGGIPEYRQTNTSLTLGNDYFMGNINGIIEKLDYIASLGVSIIYLNPIFEAHSNHRYNTADYFKIDPMLGSEEDFSNLCRKAKKRGIIIILDGVFSHTGDDSIYFNSKGRYDSIGAYNSKDSVYRSWYSFGSTKDDYASWWGIKSLPEVNENDPSFTEFITGENGVIRYWMRLGAAGFRLDVADELPDEFLDKIRLAVKAENPEGYLIGEVWEDATNKISYSKRRRFLRGRQLDSVMNYPFKNAIIDFIKGGDGYDFAESIMQILENYPPQALNNLMNHIGTHDTVRAITALAGEDLNGRDREWQVNKTLSEDEYCLGIKRLKMAAVLQYTLVGIPSLYYGDEAGMQGYSDPFCRGCFPWKNINTELYEFYKKLGAARRGCSAFKNGKLEFLAIGLGYIVFKRTTDKSSAVIGVNRWHSDEYINPGIDLSEYNMVFGEAIGGDTLKLGAESYVFLVSKGEKDV